MSHQAGGYPSTMLTAVGPRLGVTKPLRWLRGPLAALGVILLAVAMFAVAPEPVSTPTAAGLSGADLIGILAIVVTLFGLLLTAIGVMVLRAFTTTNDRITEVKTDLAGDIAQMRTASSGEITHVWRALDNVYRRLWNERLPARGDYRDQHNDT